MSLTPIMSRIKNQHYVPRFYLSNFSTNELIYVFDKFQSRAFQTNYRNVASETAFYDFSQEVIDEIEPQLADILNGGKLPDQFIEKELSRMEGFFRPFVQGLLTRIALTDPTALQSSEILDDESKFRLCEYTARQHIRTRDTREKIKEIYQKAGAAMLKMMASTHPDAPEGINWDDLEFTCDLSHDAELTLHAKAMMGSDVVERLTSILWQHMWVVGYNQTSRPLYTSDNPVVLRGHVPNPVRGEGFDAPGIEICFPLSDKVILIIFERTHFSHHKGIENRVIFLNERNIEYYNSLQVFQSYRQVYSKMDEFELARRVIKKHPRLSKPETDRIEVLGKFGTSKSRRKPKSG